MTKTFIHIYKERNIKQYKRDIKNTLHINIVRPMNSHITHKM